MRSPLGAYQRHWQHRPLDSRGGLHTEGSGEAALMKEAAECDGSE